MTTTDTERIAARAQLAERGWISRHNESFRHLPPPAADAWLGGETGQACADRMPSAAARAGWLLAPVGSGSLEHIDACWLSAADCAERAALFADLPTSSEDDAAPFFWAHRALCEAGLRLRIGSGPAHRAPVMLQLRLQSNASVEAPLVVIDVMPGAHCMLVESHEHDAGGRGGPITQNLHAYVRLGAGATLDHLRVATPGARDRIAHHVHVRIERDAQYRQSLLASGSEYHLQRTVLDLRGERALGRASGALFASAHARLEQQVRAMHASPNTQSAIDALALAGGHAQIVANAFSSIAAGASGADLRQRLSGIPTGGEPRVVLRPHLEIHHDDVQAAHGATWGGVPEDALFYACQRGLDRRDALAMIVAGMAHAALARGIDTPGRLETLGGDALLAREVARHLAEQAEAHHG
ncbi:SufD family Fe-S cluster assembly protein [Burkholderia thailandensis]|uniref:SufD family Fe-S cluster assembly protein n=1 Tax=Burkholderia thailandensis TaxID=57975 RepID=UPI002D7814CC|nr:SufD family Fe-S cluster assembly protein [Burkholderia thailandensis]WRS66913.1 SufD family Fe-S cluster assembly protein [Burkholderia thailandensis]